MVGAQTLKDIVTPGPTMPGLSINQSICLSVCMFVYFKMYLAVKKWSVVWRLSWLLYYNIQQRKKEYLQTCEFHMVRRHKHLHNLEHSQEPCAFSRAFKVKLLSRRRCPALSFLSVTLCKSVTNWITFLSAADLQYQIDWRNTFTLGWT